MENETKKEKVETTIGISIRNWNDLDRIRRHFCGAKGSSMNDVITLLIDTFTDTDIISDSRGVSVENNTSGDMKGGVKNGESNC